MSQYRSVRFRLFGLSLVSTVLVLVGRSIWADGGPSQNDSKVALRVSEFLQEGHVSKYKLDDEISRRMFRTFLMERFGGLDPTKVYFTAADIEEFRKHETTLDDEILKGDLSFAYQALERFRQRMKERMALVEEFVNAEHDFTVDEFLSTDYDKIVFATTAEEIRERWRKKVKLDLLQQRLEKKPLPEAEQKQRILKRYRNLVDAWARTDSDEVLEIYLNALTTSFDPHTNYMSPSTLEDFNIQMRLHLDGIGARLRWEDGYTIVAEVLAGGAADTDGRLQVEDKIVGVAEDGVHLLDVVDMKLKDVVKKIRGRRGTDVMLRVMPAGKMEAVEYKLTRAKIELKGQEAWGQIIEHGQKADGKPYRTGYINLPSFYLDIVAAGNDEQGAKRCSEDVRNILLDFQKPDQGVDCVILDLRTNGGGALSEAISLTGLFIDQGPVVKVKGRLSREELHEDHDKGAAYGGPLLVLVNKLSASASEIFAGAIQDYGRGLIVGDTSTHGKGTVQTIVDIRKGGLVGSREGQLGALKLTIQQFYRVNGDSTQNRGVESDIVLPSVVDHMDVGETDLPQALPFEHVNPVDHPNLGLIPKELKSQLRTFSEKRREDSTDFRKVLDDIVRWEEIKERKSITLNEEKRREERQRTEKAEEAVADPDDQPPGPDKKKKDKQVFERNYYNTEVLSIMEDFLRLGNPRLATKP